MSVDKLLNANLELRMKAEKLQEQLDQTQHQLDSSREELELKKKLIYEKNTEFKIAQNNINKLESENKELKIKLDKANDTISNLNNYLKNKEDELISLNKKIELISSEIESNKELNSKIKELEDIIEENNVIISEKTNHIKTIEIELNQLRPKMTKPIKITKGRVRACIKCSEYIPIRLNDPINQNAIKQFELNHKGHTIITVDLPEVESNYKNIELSENSE